MEDAARIAYRELVNWLASLVVHVVTEFVTVPLACVGTEALCNSPLIRQGLLARRRGALQEVFCVGVHVSSLKDAY
jgi:hypothetical protein